MDGVIKTIIRLPAKLAILLLVLYGSTISVLLGPRCRFYPSCSQYARDAIKTRGLFLGGLLAAKRILKCHPGHPGGFDPIENACAENPACKSCQCENH